MTERQESTPQRPQIKQSGELRDGQRFAANRRLRVARTPQSQEIPLPVIPKRRRLPNPAVVFVTGFAAFVLAGAVVLSLPVSSAHGGWTPFLDALFTATSAVCLTGLVVVDTGTYWSGFGLVVILVLIQLGGLGFMTSATLLLILIGRRASLRDRVLLKESMGGGGLGTVLILVRRVFLLTVVAELVGMVILTARFAFQMDLLTAVWWGLFHSISAFNNAGFDLTGGFRSLIQYSYDPVVLLTTATLFTLGALSYTVVEDVVTQRRFARFSLDTKLVLVTMFGLLAAGTLALLITEWHNSHTLGGMDLGPRLLNALFLTASRTAGFSTVDIGKITDDGLLVLSVLMFIGGASASTGGGIKVQTFSLLFFAILSTVRGVNEVEAFGRRVPTPQLMRAISIALLSVAVVFLFTFLLNATENFGFLRVYFEAVSAAATVGLSTGITPETSPLSRIIMVVAMFIGRLGPLTLALALAARQRRTMYHFPLEPVRIG